MATKWLNVRYKGTTAIQVNFKTWYPNEIHAMPESALDEFRKLRGDVLEVLGEDKGGVPGEGLAIGQEWPFGPMTDKPMAFEPTPGDELTAVAVTLTSDKELPVSVEKAQEALANPPQPQRVLVEDKDAFRVIHPQEPVVTAEKRAEKAKQTAESAQREAEQWAAATSQEPVTVVTGLAKQGQPVKVDESVPPVQGEPRTGNEPVEIDETGAKPAAKKGK